MMEFQWDWDTAGVVMSVLSDAAIIITAFVLYRQTRKVIDPPEIRKVRVHERIAQWNDPLFMDRRTGIHNYLDDASISLKDKINKFETDAKFKAGVIEILTFYEALAQGLVDGVLDENSAERYFKTAVLPLYRSHHSIIEHLQDLYGSTVYRDFADLARKWA